MGIVLAALIVLAAMPAWVPIIWPGVPSVKLRPSVIVFTFGVGLQLLFVLLVSTRIVTLDYSREFGVGGVSCCVIAIALAIADGARLRPSTGVIISSLLSAAVWLVLATLH